MPSRNLVLLLLLLPLAACEQQQAYGDPNAIILGTPTERWSEVEETIRQGLQPTIFTVRNEVTFRLTQKDPSDPDWPLLRQFRQVLLVGSPDEPWMADAVQKARDRGEDLTPPRLVQTFDVWARGQVVSLMLVPPGSSGPAVASLVDSLQTLLDSQFRQVSLTRMYASGRNDSLVVQLQRDHGFSLDLPRVYYWDRQDSVFVFRNDNPDPTRLIRQVGVTWRTPLPAELPTQEEMVMWRQEMVDAFYQDEQVTEVDQGEFVRGRLGGREMAQLQAVWANPPTSDWPRGGPMTLRAIACPDQDRLYLVDAWLYAPGEDKYQYMIQLETILNSFQCGMPE
jgi:hypothetical protein